MKITADHVLFRPKPNFDLDFMIRVTYTFQEPIENYVPKSFKLGPKAKMNAMSLRIKSL